MATLAFDVRYDNGAGVGLQVDPSIAIELREDANGANTLKSNRTLGTDATVAIVELQDAHGYLYRTIVDVSSYVEAPVRATWTATKSGNPITAYVEVLDYPTTSVFNGPFVRDYVLREFGYPTVSVEITGEQVNQCTQRALREYNRYVAREKRIALPLVKGKAGYDLNEVGTRGVARVEFTRRNFNPSLLSTEYGFSLPFAPGMQTDLFALGLEHRNTIEKITGNDPEWTFDPVTRKLWISLGSLDSLQVDLWAANVIYFENTPLQEIPEYHRQILLDLTTAYAKQIVGQVRDKYSGSVPGPSGGVKMKSSELVAEGKAEADTLLQQLRGIGAATVVPQYG